LESHRDDERIIFERTTRVRADGIARRVKRRDILWNVCDVRGNKGRQRPTERRLLLQAGTDEGPVTESDQRGSGLGCGME